MLLRTVIGTAEMRAFQARLEDDVGRAQQRDARCGGAARCGVHRTSEGHRYRGHGDLAKDQRSSATTALPLVIRGELWFSYAGLGRGVRGLVAR